MSLVLGMLLSILAVVVTAPAAQAATPGLTACVDGAGGTSNLTISSSHGKAFYIDSGVTPKLDAGYVGYKITNSSGSTKSGLWVRLSNFTGGKLGLANPNDEFLAMDPIAASGTDMAYFLLKASGASATAQSHTVGIYDRRPDLLGAQLLRSCTYTFAAVKETIKASANKVGNNAGSANGAIYVSDLTPELGQTFTITVEGATGQIGAGGTPDFDAIWLTPAAVSSWPTSAFRLSKVEMKFDGNNQNWPDSPQYTDQLLITGANGLSEVDSGFYIATYTFTVIGVPTSTVKIVPVAQIASGTQMKHSDIGATGATLDASFTAPSIPQSISKTVPTSSTGLETGTVSTIAGAAPGVTYVAVPYTVTVTSSSSTAFTLDEIVDTPGSGALVYPGSATVIDATRSTATAIPDPQYIASEANQVPRPLHFTGPFTGSSARSVILAYKLWLPATGATFSNTAYAAIGSVKIGSTASTVPKATVTTTSGTGDITGSTSTESLVVEAATDAASEVTATAAVMNGTVDANGNASTVKFDYGTDPSLSSFTTVTATTNGSLTSSNTNPVSVAYSLSSLTSGRTYYYRVVVYSSGGSVLATGDINSFTTLVVASNPTPTTIAATNITSTSATLNGTVSPNNTLVTQMYFEYSTSSSFSSSTTVVLQDTSVTPAEDVQTSGVDLQSFSANVTGLSAGTYYFRFVVCTDTDNTPCSRSGSTVEFVASSLSFSTAKTAQTITFGAIADRTYGDAAFTVSASTSSGLEATLTSLTTSVCTVSSPSFSNPTKTVTVTILTVGDCVLEAAQAGDSTYNPAASVQQSFYIGPRTLTVTAADKSKTFGDASPTFTLMVTGFKTGDDASITSVVYSFEGTSGTSYPESTTTPTAVGSYLINPSNAKLSFSTGSASNYQLAYVSGTYAISAATLSDQTIAISDYSMNVGDTYDLDRLITNGGSGVGAITYTSSNGNCTIVDSTVTGAAAGSCTITATKAADTQYNSATDTAVISITGTYTITYEYNGATTGNSTTSVTFTTGDSALTLPSPERTGYTFAGWYTEAGFTNQVTSPYTPTSGGTLYAKWTANSNTVTFHSNFDTDNTSTQTIVSGTATALTANPYSRTGHSFANWTTNSDGTGTSYSNSQSVTIYGALTLYAQWTVNTYNITYVANGGSGAPSNTTATYNSSFTISGTEPTRAGYTFAGWDDNSTTRQQSTSFTMPASNVTLTATWTANTYNVFYDDNGGSGGPADGTWVTGGTIALPSPNPTNGSLIFDGWYTAATGGTELAFPYAPTVTNDITLYAQWAPAASKRVTFYRNDGTAGNTTQYAAAAANLNANSFTRTGYTFKGWATSASGTATVEDQANYDFSADKDLYAVWRAQVSYSANGGSGTAPTDSNEYAPGASVSTAAQGSLTRSGFTFRGWNTAADGTGTTVDANSSYSMGGAVTLYAQWRGRVTYDGNGVSSNVPTDSTYYTETATATIAGAGSMARSGYTFSGWATQSNGGGSTFSENGSLPMTNGDVTLYAQWRAQVTYNGNSPTSGSAPTDATQHAPGASVSVKNNENSLSRSGFTFAGWNTQANGKGTDVSAGGTYTMGGAVTLYAKWIASVTYDANDGDSGSVPTDAADYSPDDSVTVKGNDNSLARTGYTFAGWNTAANGSGTARAAASSFAMSGAVTLYAQWSPIDYSVSYDANGGTGTPPTGANNKRYQDSVAVAAGTGLSRTGYTFGGWEIDGDSNTYGPNNTTSYTMGPNSVTFKAKWVAVGSKTVTFKKNDGSNDQATQAGNSAANLTTNSFTRAGYDFGGWANAANSSAVLFADATSYDFANDITLYAIWTARTLTLSYDSQGGSSVPSTTFVTGGSVSTAPADPTRSGYTFDGWFANASGGSRITFPYSPNATSNVTVYAQWTIVRTSGRGGGSPAPSTPVTPPSNNNGLGGTTDKDLKINPAKPVVATTPGKTEVTSKPDNSTIKIAESKLPEVKGLAKAQIVNDEIVYTAKPGFSGVMQVPVEITKNGVTEIVTVPVTVNPEPVAAAKTPKTKSQTIVRWDPSPNALEYVVTYDGKIVCATAATTCAIPDLLGPKAKVDVTALGNDNTASTKTIPVYAPEKPVPVSAVNFDENSAKLDAAARTKLKKFAQLVIKQGFTTVVIEGHTDGQGGSKNATALSLARANATAKFLRQFLKVEVVKNPKGEKQPVASNDTKFGQAKNRRATISVK